MKIPGNVKSLRIVAAAAGALAVLPLTTNAKITDHDKPGAVLNGGAKVYKQEPDSRDAALAMRFGTYSGIGDTGGTSRTAEAAGLHLGAWSDHALEKTLRVR